MPKSIKYKILVNEINVGPAENPYTKQIFASVISNWSEAAEEIAKKEAFNGEYAIEDDGKPESVVKPTQEERIAELEEALELLLSGVTE